MKKIFKLMKREIFPVAKSVFSLMVIFSMLGMSAAPLAYAGGPSDLSITCDSVSVSGNTWTLSGTWKALNFAGQSNQYDAAVFSPSGTLADGSSKDNPDTFVITAGPSEFPTDTDKKDDMQGTWSNQVTFLTTPSSIAATLYHSQVPGNESSGDAVCTFVIKPTLTLQNTVVKDNGGTAVDTDWTLSASGPTPISGVEGSLSVTGATVNAGAYTLSASGPSGYTASQYSCVKNGDTAVLGNSLSLVNGDNAVCTITHDDNATSTPPVLSGVPATATVDELDTLNFTATATDTDIPANTLSFSLTGTVPTGASINATSGAFSWTPTEAQGPGVYSFFVTVSDGAHSVSAPITVTVNEVNIKPVAGDDATTTSEDTPVVISLASLLSNDTDADIPANTLSITAVSGFDDGVAVLGVADVTFTPDSNFNGTAGFDYTLSDGVGGTDQGHVTIQVGPENDAPTLADIVDQIVDELSLLSFTVDGDDVDMGDTLNYSIFSGAQTGMNLDSTTGAFTWTPTEAQGPAVYPVTINVSDGLASVAKSFSITVNEKNIKPVAYDASVTTPMNQNKNIQLVATDVDIPANTLTFEIITQPTYGDLPLSGSIATYDPDPGYVGSDSFTFKVCDQDNACDTGTISIEVSNDAPQFEEVASQEVDELTPLSVSPVAVDPNGDVLTFSLSGDISPATEGLTFDGATGIFSWTPTEAQGGNPFTVYNVILSVSDGASTDSTTFTITVKEVNSAPVAQDSSATTDEDVPVNIVLPIGSDSDIPTQTLTYTIVDVTTNGSVVLSGDTVLYTPTTNFNGTDSFTYKVSDGVTESNVATVLITVHPVNDAPTITLDGSSEIALFVGDEYNEEGATCADVDGDETSLLIDGSVVTSELGNYILSYTCTDKQAESSPVTRSVTIQAAPAACMDGIDNDQDGKIDFAGGDPGCSSPSDNDETDPVYPQCSDGIDNDNDGDVDYPADSGCKDADDNNEESSGGSSGSIPRGGGQVLGAFIGPSVLGEEMCGEYITDYIKLGAKNDKANVSRLQTFLNKYMGLTLAVDGVYGPATFNAVKQFQIKEASEVLNPWIGVTLKSPIGTGWVYKTTKRRINMIECPKLNIPQFEKAQLTIN